MSVSFNWSEPLLLEPQWRTFELQGRKATIPVLAPAERAAEKVRAYLSPARSALGNDAYDLY